LSILHVLTLGKYNTCKGTSKGHLTIKTVSRKYLTVCCPKTAAKDSHRDRNLEPNKRSKTDLLGSLIVAQKIYMVSEPMVA
jgi:hypothetical protein